MTPLDQVLLRAYLDGALDAPATEAFEILMIARPDLAAAVEADTALAMGLAPPGSAAAAPTPRAQAADTSASVAERAADDPTGPGSSLNPAVADSREIGRVTASVPARSAPGLDAGRRQPARWLPMAAAAGVLLAVGFAAGSWRQAGVPALGEATLAYVDKTRSISTTPTIALARAGTLVLLVPVAAPRDCRADITLRQDGRASLQAQAQPDEFGYASLVLAQDAVVAGPARVEVRCAGAVVADYPVEFTAPSSP